MGYDAPTFKSIVQEYGEVWFVLDSDREYQIHGTEGYTLTTRGSRTFVEVEGLRGDEYLVAEFPLDSIEHHYTHKEI